MTIRPRIVCKRDGSIQWSLPVSSLGTRSGLAATVGEATTILIAMAEHWNGETITRDDIELVRETIVYEPMLPADRAEFR